MPGVLRTTLLVGNLTGLGVGTFIDSNGGQVQIGGTATAPVYGTAQELGRLTEFIAELQVTAGSGGSVTVQDSWDGVSWNPWIVFSPVTGVLTNPGQVPATNPRNPGPIVRAQAVVASGGSGYAVQVRLTGTERIG